MAVPRKLPPLNSIRAFEAAYRHMSFALAADELAVTPSAVSQQVKNLEDWLGVPLFHRLPRGLEASEAARKYAPGLTDALDLMVSATRTVRPDTTNTLTISTLPSFGGAWLAPRLSRFTDANPDIDFRLSTTNAIVNFDGGGIDAAIRHGRGEYPDLSVSMLIQDILTPVCSPALMQGEHPIGTIDDLKHHHFLHDSDAWADSLLRWDNWLARAGRPDIARDRGTSFSDSYLCVQAAIAGRGVMIGSSALVGDALMNGALVAPLDIQIPYKVFYRFITPKGVLPERVTRFRDWLIAEVEEFHTAMADGGFAKLSTNGMSNPPES